jgi:5-methylthioadenosine/S-adenosylhomocysteine deaminase
MPSPRMLISGGRVLDMDGDLDQPAVADIYIENGHITVVGAGATTAASQYVDVKKVDAHGKLIIPGLINAHYHSHDVMLRGMFEQLPLDAWMLYAGPANYTRPLAHQIKLRTTLGAAECLLNGITTVQDMPTIVGADHEHVDAILSSYEESGIRVVLAPQFSDRAPIECVPFWRDSSVAKLPMLSMPTDTRALRRLLTERVGKADIPRQRWALGPSGPQRCTDDLLSWTAALALRHGLQIFTHLYEARSQAVLARQEYAKGSLIEHLAKFDLLGPHLTIAHGVWISSEEIERFGEASANVTCNPVSNMKLLNGFAPVVQYAQSGAGIALGCDNCSGNDSQNMFQSMKTFALLWGMYSQAGETGAARAAFKAATVGGASAVGMSGQLGLVRPGYKADLVLIDLNNASYRPLNSAIRQLVYSESGKGVDTVLVDGQIVVEKSSLKTVSEASLKEQAETWRAKLAIESKAVHKRNVTFLADILSAYEKANRYPIDFDRFLLRKH